MCSTDISSVTPVKVYTQKEQVLLETSISEFHEKYYTPAFQKLVYHFTHVHIFGTHHCGKECHESFKRCRKQHGVLWWSDYKDRIVSIFAHQIKSEYYGGNCYVSIGGIAVDNFSVSNHSSSSLTSEIVSCQAFFNLCYWTIANKRQVNL